MGRFSPGRSLRGSGRRTVVPPAPFCGRRLPRQGCDYVFIQMVSMMLLLKILCLLWLINFAPPLLACLLGEKWNTPVDRGRLLPDGEPLFGAHKTQRGIAAGCAMGAVAGVFLGFPWWAGAITGVLSMGGDLLSSFLKRRLRYGSGKVVPGLDQLFEGGIPLLFLGAFYQLSGVAALFLVFVFGAGAYAGSLFFNSFLMRKPFETYPRTVSPDVRFKELRSCHVTSRPLHHLLNFEDAVYYQVIMKTAFRLLGLYDRGKRNALIFEENRVAFDFEDLPDSFDGYTVLFLSDLHLDGLEGLTERIQSAVRDLRVDLCILGGDFRMETYGPFNEALAELQKLIPEIRAKDGILSILGNHDCPDIVKPLSDAGVTCLVNDAVAIERNGERIWIVGVDDPHYYQCHDLEEAYKEVPDDAFSILAAHSNEIYREASRFNPSLYLCGHSHAGQIRLPILGPIFTHSKAPRRLCFGRWQYNGMAGYTSAGVGVSGAPVRFFSKGEVLLITLRRTDVIATPGP